MDDTKDDNVIPLTQKPLEDAFAFAIPEVYEVQFTPTFSAIMTSRPRRWARFWFWLLFGLRWKKIL